jgi:membrane associated rhomboid family serine protease
VDYVGLIVDRAIATVYRRPGHSATDEPSCHVTSQSTLCSLNSRILLIWLAIPVALYAPQTPMFIPLGDDNSRRRRVPLVMWLLVVLNGTVWFFELAYGERFIAAYAAIPFELSTGLDLTTTKYISIQGERIAIPQAPGPSPIYLTLLTSMFMHGSWMHLFGNMIYLLIFGDQIEDRLGHLRFLVFYLLAGVAAGLAQVIATPTSVLPCVGASGAIAAVLGAYLVLHPRNFIHVLLFRSIVSLPAFVVLGFWGVMQVLGHFGNPSEQGGVAYMAHIGGFVVGIGGGFLLRLLGQRR